MHCVCARAHATSFIRLWCKQPRTQLPVFQCCSKSHWIELVHCPWQQSCTAVSLHASFGFSLQWRKWKHNRVLPKVYLVLYCSTQSPSLQQRWTRPGTFLWCLAVAKISILPKHRVWQSPHWDTHTRMCTHTNTHVQREIQTPFKWPEKLTRMTSCWEVLARWR